ncbi:hypothetical protein V7107_06090 [Bacillus toyonensis]|nr:hypothetical protein [Bacillus toyonensis]PEO51224.1 hypothetical protein CN579_28400 [Bacillus toyonensis]
MEGLLNGISSMASAIWDKVTEIASGVKNALTGLFDIHSPSRWMRDMIGINMIKGWINGIEGMKGAMVNTSTAMSEWMQPEMPNVQMTYSTPASISSVSSSVGQGNSKSIQTTNPQVSNANNSSRNIVIENVVMLDGYEIARSSQPYLDDMQAGKMQIKSYMQGGR